MSTDDAAQCEWKILEKIHQILREERANGVPNEEPVIRFHHPDDLKVTLLVLLTESSMRKCWNSP